MSTVANYILSVLAASILYAVILSFTEGKGVISSLLRLICGIFLTFIVIAPAAEIQIETFPSLWDNYVSDADLYVADGVTLTEKATADIITEQTKAYILGEAEALGLSLSVEVELSDDSPCVPVGIVLKGEASPYARSSLTRTLSANLDIPKENVIWLS